MLACLPPEEKPPLQLFCVAHLGVETRSFRSRKLQHRVVGKKHQSSGKERKREPTEPVTTGRGGAPVSYLFRRNTTSAARRSPEWGSRQCVHRGALGWNQPVAPDLPPGLQRTKPFAVPAPLRGTRLPGAACPKPGSAAPESSAVAGGGRSTARHKLTAQNSCARRKPTARQAG